MPNDIEDQIRRGQYEDIYRSRLAATGSRDPRRMRPDEIIAEINAIRETVDLAARRISDLARTLYAHSRRNTDSTTPAYIAFANTWTRLAGAVQQGLRRTSTTDRLLSRAIESQREASAPPPKTERVKKQEVTSESPIRNANPLQPEESRSMNDLMELYGKEILRDAGR